MTSSLGVSYVSGVGYNVLGQPRQYTLGSGTTATASLRYYGLDVVGYPFGALQRMELQQGSSPMLVDREMTYDQVGNVTGVNDRVSGENISYGYDDLDRLTGAGSPLNESYTYSEIGNLTAKSGQTLAYADPAHVHAVTAFGSTSYSYDANGSMTARGTGSIRYDAERRPVRVNEGASVLWRASYDGDGSRRKRVDGKGTIHYLGGYERNVGNGQDTSETVTKYYRALGRLIAFRRNGSLYWVGTDHLGGTVAVASSSFGLVAGMRYTPYGLSRDNTDDPLTDSLFTSQKLDASVGLYWYGSRAYDQSLGRFVSPDTIVPSAGNPQSLNRFSYAANNPVRYADPSGHDPYEGMGIVVYDNPSYLPVEVRQALYEHNSESSVSNGSQGTVHVHESGGGGEGGGSAVSAVMLDVGVQPLQPMDPDWAQAFTHAHGYAPNEQDWQDRQVSLTHPGTGPNGTWTDQDWQTYSREQSLLHAELMNQIGKQGSSGADVYSAIALAIAQGIHPSDLNYEDGPDGTVIATTTTVPPNTGGITFGNVIVLTPEKAKDPATVAHEYVHVLQYRATGISYGVEYFQGGFYNWEKNPLEVQAVKVEDLYRANPWLPRPWDIRWTGQSRQYMGPR